MEFLKKYFDGEKPLTFEQLREKVEADTGMKLVNLAEGGYVAKEKMDSKVTALTTELTGVKDQLTAANQEIKTYKDMDIEGIRKSAQDWENRYNTDTKALQDKLTAQNRDFATRTYLGSFHYANDLVKDAVYARFKDKDFKMEGDKFLGADDFMAEMQKQYPTGFIADGLTEPPAEPQPQEKKPIFAPPQPPNSPKKKMTLVERMQFHNEHPDAPINFDT